MSRRMLAGIVFVVLALALASMSAGAAPKYKDGTQFGVSDADAHGYMKAVVTIENGKIATVELAETLETGAPKGEDYPLEAWHELMRVLPQRFVEANSATVDVATGASHSSAKAMQAVARALDKALAQREGSGKYFDGVFQGSSAADDHGYAVVRITVQDDRIIEAVLSEITETGEWKDYETYPNPNIPKGRITMTERFVEAGSADVDLATGASHSSAKWVEAVEEALSLAVRAAQ